MKILVILSLGLLLTSCASKKTVSSSASAKQALEDRYKNRIGAATKADFVEYFGTAEWCRPQPEGEDLCRFYKKVETKWLGDKTDRKHYEAYDQVIATFDHNGLLKGFKAEAIR